MQKLASQRQQTSNSVNTSKRQVLPNKQAPQFNINIANRSQAGNFKYENLRLPEYTIWAQEQSRRINQSWPFFKQNNSSISEQPIYKHQTLGTYLRKLPPVPAGVHFREVPLVKNNGKIDYEKSIRKYTNLLNANGYNVGPLAENVEGELSWLEGPIYHADGKDAADWLYNRRGLKLTPDMWDKATKARSSNTSQLGLLPPSVYFAWQRYRNNFNMPFNAARSNNQHINMYGYRDIDDIYTSDGLNQISGYTQHDQDGQMFEPWERLMRFQDMQDHELSHSFNFLPSFRYVKQLDKHIEGIDDAFFSARNDSNNPMYTKQDADLRKAKYFDLFRGTYFGSSGGVPEYIGAMSRVKRYGKELGFDTFSSNPKKARYAMSQTLHYLAAHTNPKELTSEQQRIHSWLNTAVRNYRYRDPEFETLSEKLDNARSEEELHEYSTKRKQLQDSFIHDVNSPFYKDVLDFMTDSTIQGLVRTNPNLNNIYLT